MLNLTPEQQQRLGVLRAIKDAVAFGQSVGSVEYNGERTQFNKPDLNEIKREIAALEGGYGTVRIRL
jgi:hypothetical protein